MKKIVVLDSGLGNQMFQYVFFLNLKKIYGEKNVKMDLSYFLRKDYKNLYELKKIFNIEEKEKNIYYSYENNILLKIYKKLYLRLKKVYFEDRNENIINILRKKEGIFDGTWVVAQYAENFKSEINKIYNFPNFTEDKNLQIEKKIKESNSVSIHVRRGDYLKLSKYINLSESDYYLKAIEKIKLEVVNPTFFIFSDDIDWCKKNLNFEKNKVYYIDWNNGEKSFRDMQLMSICKYNIIANSTFSWWGAYLNNYSFKIVIAPKNYFNSKEKKNVNISNFYPKEWIKM